VRALAARMIERMGFAVITAADGLEAVETFRQHEGEIACVLLDLIMPRLDGVAAFSALRKLRPGSRSSCAVASTTPKRRNA